MALSVVSVCFDILLWILLSFSILWIYDDVECVMKRQGWRYAVLLKGSKYEWLIPFS